MKKSTVAIAVVVGFLCLIGLAAGIVAFGYFAVNGFSPGPSTDAQKRLVLNAATFEAYDVALDPKCLKLTAKRNLDATRQIEFVHDCAGGGIHITSGAEISPSIRDARQSFALGIGAYRTGMAIGDAELQPRDDLLSLGDQQYAAIIRKDRKPVGNLFVVRQGRVLHTLLLTGIYFEEA